MGQCLAPFFRNLYCTLVPRVIMLGLDNAGKTTILYYKVKAPIPELGPTVGFNAETVTTKGFRRDVWDIGGQQKLRPLWAHYYQRTDVVIFVVDSTDRERITEAREALHSTLASEELRDVTVLVFANKQDLPNPMQAEEVTEMLELNKISSLQRWHVQECSAETGKGIDEGFKWLVESLKERYKVNI